MPRNVFGLEQLVTGHLDFNNQNDAPFRVHHQNQIRPQGEQAHLLVQIATVEVSQRVQAHFHNALDVVGDCRLIFVGEDLSTIFFNESLIRQKRLEGRASKFVFVIDGKVQIVWCDELSVNGETCDPISVLVWVEFFDPRHVRDAIKVFDHLLNASFIYFVPLPFDQLDQLLQGHFMQVDVVVDVVVAVVGRHGVVGW